MAVSLDSAGFSVLLNWVYSDGRAVAPTSNSGNFSFAQQYTNGTGLGKANRVFVQRYTVAFGTPLDLDLAGGLTDWYGNTITFTKIKCFGVGVPYATVGGTAPAVLLGCPASNGFVAWLGDKSDLVRVPNGFAHILGGDGASGGFAVTAGTGDIMEITAETSGSAVINVAFLGEG